MKVHWTDWATTALLLGAGCAAIYAGLSRALRYPMAERQREMERRISGLTTTVKALQARVAELVRIQAAAIDNSQQPVSEKSETNEPLKPETLAALTAAATAFVGKKALLRSAKALATEETGTVWAQQGRVIVQTSHNLRQNG